MSNWLVAFRSKNFDDFPLPIFFFTIYPVILVFNGHCWHKGKVTACTRLVNPYYCGKGICLKTEHDRIQHMLKLPGCQHWFNFMHQCKQII